MKYAYRRTRTYDQMPKLQLAALKRARCSRTPSEDWGAASN